MTETTTITRNKIIGDALAEYELNGNTAAHLCTAEEYANEVLREHGHPPLDGEDMKVLFKRARHAAIKKACAELTTSMKIIPCSQCEYVDQALREIDQPGITGAEIREFGVRLEAFEQARSK